MLDFYEFVEGNPHFRQFNVDELLFTAYDCPLEASPLDYWVNKNYFCYVIKGGARWKTSTDEYILQVGDAAFLKKGAHRVFKILTGEFCALLIFTPDSFIRSVIRDDVRMHQQNLHDGHSDSVIPLVLNQSLNDYFKTFLNFFLAPLPPSKSLLKIKFKELVINLFTSIHNPVLVKYFQELSFNSKRDLTPIMEEHFIFNLKLLDYARLSGRSLSSFKRDFTKEFKTTPGKWLTLKRLEYSKFLLETTALNISEITHESGFENASHFIKLFKQHYTVSPLKFRKSLMVR